MVDKTELTIPEKAPKHDLDMFRDNWSANFVSYIVIECIFQLLYISNVDDVDVPHTIHYWKCTYVCSY